MVNVFVMDDIEMQTMIGRAKEELQQDILFRNSVINRLQSLMFIMSPCKGELS